MSEPNSSINVVSRFIIDSYSESVPISCVIENNISLSGLSYDFNNSIYVSK